MKYERLLKCEMATEYINGSFTGNDSIIEEGIVKETDIKTDVYESLQKTKDCEVYQTLEKSKTDQEVDTKRCKYISRKKIIYVFLIFLSVTVIGTLTGVIILFASKTKTDVCQSRPCHAGICIPKGDNFDCACLPGYTGRFCENNIDECSSVSCGNGKCINGIGSYHCSCNVGFDGTNCDRHIGECSSVSCGNGTCINSIGSYHCSCNVGFGGTNCDRLLSDCVDILRYGGDKEDGVYTIRTWKSHQFINVYCDMTTDGGGWSVFQYRFNGSVDFYRIFSEYELGFGNLKTEFWLGLRYIEELASQGRTDLRVDLEAANGKTGFETFENFSLSAGPAYTLHIGSTIASSGISRIYNFRPYHNGQDFTTYDHDADSAVDNCAVTYHGAWWYRGCLRANLNGEYMSPGTRSFSSMFYRSFLEQTSLKSSKMMMRRKSE